MNNVIQFSLKDLGYFTLWVLIIIILYYIIMILKDVFLSVREIKKLLKENAESVDQVLKETPDLAKNINVISKEVGDTMVKFRGSVDNIAETSEGITQTIKEKDTINKELTSIFHTIAIIKQRYNTFIKND